MLPSLNYEPTDPKYMLLGKIFDFLDSKKSLNCLSRAGIKNREMIIFCIKILFMSMFFDYTVSGVVNELNRSNKLRKFMKTNENLPTVEQVYEFLSRSSAEQYCKYVNSILNMFNKKTRGKYNKFIVDATPSACDFNLDKKFITPEHLEKLKLKWSYSTTKGSYIGFKVTMVLNKKTMSPVSILIHAGAPHDSRIFDEILKELKRRRIIKDKDIILYDRGYFSYKNYLIGVNKYKIVPVIFPNNKFSIGRLKALMSLPLEACDENQKVKELKNKITSIVKLLYAELENWDDLKPIRGIIEDFFKVAKNAFGLGEFHSYTVESMSRNIYLCLLLTALIVQEGYKTKTKLQRLAEGDVVQDTPITKKTNNKEEKSNENNKIDEDSIKKEKTGQQVLKYGTKFYQSKLL